MNTLIVNVQDNINIEQIINSISMLKGIEKVELNKTNPQLLLEKMEAGEYVSDDEYLGSIPGYMEELDKASKEPWEECVPIEEVIPGWRDRKKRSIDV